MLVNLDTEELDLIECELRASMSFWEGVTEGEPNNKEAMQRLAVTRKLKEKVHKFFTLSKDGKCHVSIVE